MTAAEQIDLASNVVNADPFAYLADHLTTQKAAFLANPMPTAQARITNLKKLKKVIIKYSDQLLETTSQDFSNRSIAETHLAEIFPLLNAIDYNIARIKKWMKPSRRHVPLTVMPASVKVHYQPLGVVGIVVPWNFPTFLGLSPLVSALAAGNSAMLKMSEFAPRTGELVQQMIEETFDANHIAVFTGELDVAQAFTQLPFDHLVFTGATPVGKIVMKAAAENLTPVTLELGGKSPAIIHESFPIEEAAERLIFGKGMNAGQICVSPDYVLCPKAKVSEFAQAVVKVMERNYPTIRDNDDYTAVISDRQHARLRSYLEDAEQKGAQLITINPSSESFEGTRKFPLTLVLNTNETMLVEQEEIFGPILPIKGYDSLDSALSYVNERDRPLALYYFDFNKSRANDILARTHSGGVCINDTLSHVGADDAPFGGIGPSGMGHYHGKEGFINFSKAKTVVRKGRIDSAKFVAPPWNKPMYKMLIALLWFKHKRFGK